MKLAKDVTGGQYEGRIMLPTERTFKNKQSGGIGVAGFAHGKSRTQTKRRLSKEFGRIWVASGFV